MKLTTLLGLALSYHTALVGACGGHGQELKHWSQEELDDLERKWGVEVCKYVQLPVIRKTATSDH